MPIFNRAHYQDTPAALIGPRAPALELWSPVRPWLVLKTPTVKTIVDPHNQRHEEKEGPLTNSDSRKYLTDEEKGRKSRRCLLGRMQHLFYEQIFHIRYQLAKSPRNPRRNSDNLMEQL